MSIIEVNIHSYSYRLFRDIGIAMVYPLIIFLSLLLANWDYGTPIINEIERLAYILPFALSIVMYKIYRGRYHIKKVELGEGKLMLYLEYFGKQKIVELPLEKVSYSIKRDKSTLWEYYVFKIQGPNVRISQYQQNGWDKEAFSELLTLLKEANVDGQNELQ